MSTAAAILREDCWCTSPIGRDPVKVTSEGRVVCTVDVATLPYDDSVRKEIGREKDSRPVISRLLKRRKLLKNQGKKGVHVLKNNADLPLSEWEIKEELEDVEYRLTEAIKIAKTRGKSINI